MPNNSDFRVIFMGTPEFAVASLKALLDAGMNIVAVVTAPDKPAGRGQKVQETDVKKFAKNLDIPILQPDKLKNTEFLGKLQSLQADLNIVVAFRMLPELVWSMPRLGTINLHASLLPQYRGAAPINWAIMNGESITGVTTFFIEKEIDTGKIIFSEKVEITDNDTAGSLHDKLMNVGANLLVKTAVSIWDNNYNMASQHTEATTTSLKTAPKIFKEDCKIHWNHSLDNIYNFVRGLSPYPAAWTVLSNIENDQKLSVKIFETQKEEINHGLIHGTLISDEKKFVKVAVNGGYLSLKTIQVEGKKRLEIEEFLRGFKNIQSYRVE